MAISLGIKRSSRTVLMLVATFGINAAHAEAVSVGSFYGEWDSDTTYSQGSIVTAGGSTYISVHGSFVYPNRNHPPPTSAKWWTPLASQVTQNNAVPPGPGGGMVVKDGNGKVVGPYLYTPAFFESVAVQAPNGPLVFALAYQMTAPSGVRQFEFYPGPNVSIHYATKDCTGVAYVDPAVVNNAQFLHFHYQLISGASYYPVPSPGAAVESVVLGSSTQYEAGARKGPACSVGSGNVVSAIALTNGTPLSALGFSPPFTIQIN